MAIITYSELIDWIKKHPEYSRKLRKDVSASVALYIRFAPVEPGEWLESEILETPDNMEVRLDHDKNGKVYGIEFY